MPSPTTRTLRRALTVTSAGALLAAVALLAAPDAPGPPTRVAATTADAVDRAAPTTTSTTTTTTTAPPPPPAPTTTTRAPAAAAPDPEPTTVELEVPAGAAADATRQAFGAGLFDQAWRVAGCESRHDPSAVSAGGGNLGLFQINYVHADAFEEFTGLPYHDGALDPYANAAYARHLFDEAGGWGPWACRWAA